MTGETIEKLVIKISADIEQAQRELNEAKASIKKMGAEAESTGNRMQSSGQKMTAALNAVKIYAVAAAAALAAMGYKAITAAGDAEEIRNKFEAVFKDTATGAEAWAETFSNTVGRSTLETLQYLSTFQDTFVPLGFDRDEASELSEQLVQLSVDLASFNNELDTDAIASLQSALVGNHETMRRYGVIITQATLDQELLNMGIAGGVQKASEMEKVQARLNIIMGSTTDAQGDAARTADSYANQMRALKGNIADVMAEAGDDAMDDLTDTIIEFNEWGTSGGYDNITMFLGDVASLAADAAKGVAILTQTFTDLYGTFVAEGTLPEQMGTSGTLSEGGILDLSGMSNEQMTDIYKQLGFNEDQISQKLEHRNQLIEAGKKGIEEQVDAVNQLKNVSSSIPDWAGKSDYVRSRMETTGTKNLDELMSVDISAPEIPTIQSVTQAAKTPTKTDTPMVSLVDINRNGFNSLASKMDGVIQAVQSIQISSPSGSSSGVSSDEVTAVRKATAVNDIIKVTPRWL
ncbi:hypothetical protein V7O66_13720 [Methanolobus sp. ZRKC3]|uniref:hypothetical protein n=1 Tax=Methanolobus sp. ZRKC3 TaxID=3125786 RepID=UPI0032524D28